MKVIIITGTPGTGKTRVSKRIAKEKGYKYVDVKKVIEDNKLKERYDRKRQTYDVDVKKLNLVLMKKINEEKLKKTKGLVIDSHLSHHLNPRHVDLCIVTKTELKKLKHRLEKRGYSKNKIRENLDAEIFDVCLNEAKETGHKIKLITT
ncbi:adenylate kinase family protein [Candidatus Woesearchaeota archaeon]|nr:adenylate kinase family protein [Candidatus Woesearchaeota archaeon]